MEKTIQELSEKITTHFDVLNCVQKAVIWSTIEEALLMPPPKPKLNPNESESDRVIRVLENNGVKLIKEHTRKGTIVYDRQLVMYFLNEKTKLSFAKIGEICGGFDHTTAMHACKTIKNYIATDKEKRAQIERLDAKL